MAKNLVSISLGMAAVISLAVAPALADPSSYGSSRGYGGMSGSPPSGTMGGASMSGSWGSTGTNSAASGYPSDGGMKGGTVSGQNGWANSPGEHGGNGHNGNSPQHGRNHWADIGSWWHGDKWHGGGHHHPKPPVPPTPPPTPTPTPVTRLLGLSGGGGSSSSMPDYNCSTYGYANAPWYCGQSSAGQ